MIKNKFTDLIEINNISKSKSTILTDSFNASATVISVIEVYKQVIVEEPYEECYIEETPQDDGSATNQIIGALLGGAIGSAINNCGDADEDGVEDDCRAEGVSRLAGILIGMAIANDAEKANSNGLVVSQEVCETKIRQRTQTKFSHYKVTVDYNGRNLLFSSKQSYLKDEVINVKVTIGESDE